MPEETTRTEEAIANVSALRWPSLQNVSDEVIREETLTVMTGGAGNYALLCAPTDLEALAIGFAFSEGLLDDPIGKARVTIERGGLWNSVARLEMPEADDARGTARNMIVSSSCGLCGAVAGKVLSGPEVGDRLRVNAAGIFKTASAMRKRQEIFARTGGAHAAAIFDADYEIASFAEDLGRHNALDKAVGKLLLAGRSPQGMGVILSGRISLELVLKAARAGLEVLAAVSAPTSLALAAAEARNLTVCGFVRENRLTVYTHARRVRDLSPDANREGRIPDAS
ncbi:MAG TPA: formate dehydrogenase accessory sulfurtransferase FdhD [Candidatus Brocadiia bacterium]|nr:formate dehydrogenase accessory sulfurtransferase FdhD [Candidatus Brocadiia bacterium]